MTKEKRGGGNIPPEIVEEILVKLPVKLLVRFKAVSNVWRGIIESTYFVEKHIEYQKYLGGQQVSIVAVSRPSGRVLKPMMISADGFLHDIFIYLPIRTCTGGFYISEPCDGLLCVYTSTRMFTIVNPATTSCRTLPDPTSTIVDGYRYRFDTLAGIGRENSESGKYKLLWFFGCDDKEANETTRCMVFALDSNTWRYIDPPQYRFDYCQPLLHLDGVMYCFTYYMERLLAFDLHTETFQSFLSTPDIRDIYIHQLDMRVLNNRLCIFKSFVDDDDRIFKIWGLNINTRSWEMMYSIELSCFPPEFKKPSIIPVATINNYLIITNSSHNIWVLYRFENRIVYHTSLPRIYLMSYFETLVSAHQ